MAREYLIELDVIEGHKPLTGADVPASALKPYGWRSIGAKGPTGSKYKGGTFTNKSGETIVAMRLKANKAGDTLNVTPESVGRLFGTVWLKNDGKEVLFLDGNIPPYNGMHPDVGLFWMYVPRNEDNDLASCDKCHYEHPQSACLDSCPFTGQVFKKNPPPPSVALWTKIKQDERLVSKHWKALLSACPSNFRDIRVYAESADRRSVLFVSGAVVLLFRANTRSVSMLVPRDTNFSNINRIAYENGGFVLLCNGRVIRSVDLSKDRFVSFV